MKQLHTKWNRLSAKQQVAFHLSAVIILLFLCYVFLGCPPLNLQQAFRRAEKASMTGPAEILAQLHPAGYPYHGLVLARSGEDVAVFAYDRKDPSRSQLVYRENAGDLAVLAAPGDVLYQYEHTATVPLVLFDGHKTAVRAELDITLQHDGFQKTYSLETLREHPSCFCFLLSVRGAGPLGDEGAALRQLQEICSNSMAGNLDVAIPVTVRLYDGEDALILESESVIRSAAAQAQAENWPGYSGTMDGYEYFHTGERDRIWEEDILYLAERYLETHPMLADIEIMHNVTEIEPHSLRFEIKHKYSDELYNETTKNAFIASINELIPRVSELTGVEIAYEINRILTTLGDAHVGLNIGWRDHFPIEFEAIYKDGDPSYYAVRVLQGFEHLLLGKLTAINGVPIDDIVDRLRVYQPHENEYWLINSLANSYCYGCLLTEIDALQIIGVAEANATDAVFTFETENGVVDAAIPIVSADAYETEQLVSHPMLEHFAFHARKGNYWHDLINEGKTLYIRFCKMYEDPEYLIYNFLGEIQKIIRESETPLQIVFDFRNNHGGNFFLEDFNRLVTAINQSPTNGIYILINNGSYSAGNIAAYRLRHGIMGAELVGSPTGQFVNTFGDRTTYTLPHNGCPFYVPTLYYWIEQDITHDAQYPDIWVEQTLEDCKNNIDTVLQYVLDLK